MHRVVHFEVSADDPERALRFYSDVFGWKAQKWEGEIKYWLITTGEDGQPGINGGLFPREGEMRFTSHVNTVDVPSLEEAMARVTGHGGRITMPKTAIPGVGYFAYCQDTEGNTFGIMQDDPAAA